MTDVLTIANDRWRLGLLPENGGSVASGQVRVGGQWLDVLRPTPEDRLGVWWDVASFPLAPWSNRIRHGTLLWNGDAYQLRRWGVDDFALHGTAVEFPWEVVGRADERVVLEFDARAYYGVNWPWDFVARTEYALEGGRLAVRTTVENVDDEPFPAGTGHHPYFVRRLVGEDGAPVGEEALLRVNCSREYALENGMPDEGPGPLNPISDFSELRVLGDAHVDVCQTGRTGPVAATIDYPGTITIDLTADEVLSHVVTYIPVGKDFFAVEPVSNANDGFTLLAKGIDGSGVVAIEPGSSLVAEFGVDLREKIA